MITAGWGCMITARWGCMLITRWGCMITTGRGGGQGRRTVIRGWVAAGIAARAAGAGSSDRRPTRADGASSPEPTSASMPGTVRRHPVAAQSSSSRRRPVHRYRRPRWSASSSPTWTCRPRRRSRSTEASAADGRPSASSDTARRRRSPRRQRRGRLGHDALGSSRAPHPATPQPARAPGDGSTATTRAPAAAAIITADRPTPPQPCTATQSPAATRPCTSTRGRPWRTGSPATRRPPATCPRAAPPG